MLLSLMQLVLIVVLMICGHLRVDICVGDVVGWESEVYTHEMKARDVQKNRLTTNLSTSDPIDWNLVLNGCLLYTSPSPRDRG